MDYQIELLDHLNDEFQRMLQRAWNAPTLEALGAVFGRIEARLTSGVGYALAIYDMDHIPRGILLWHWDNEQHTYARGTTLYAENQTGDVLVDEMYRMCLVEPALLALSVGVRGESPGAREALLKRDAIFFERCEMTCDIDGTLPDVALPDGYRMVPWTDDVNPLVEVAAVASTTDTIDEVAVPDTTPEQLVEVLRQLRANEYPGITGWSELASPVILDAQGRCAGYISTCAEDGAGFVADVAVHPDHRRRGLARLLMTRSMKACLELGYTKMGLTVTTRNPARYLYESLGFRVVACDETAVWWRDGRQLAWREAE